MIKLEKFAFGFIMFPMHVNIQHRFLKCWILPVETAEPTNVSWTREERNQMEDKLMSNQTSDIITEEDGNFSKSRK